MYLKTYISAFFEITKNWLFIVFFLVDVLFLFLDLLGSHTEFSPLFYFFLLLTGYFITSIHTLAIKNSQIEALKKAPYIISNDNLSIDAKNKVNSMRIKNISKVNVKVTAITADREATIDIVDEHYPRNFVLGGLEELNLMIDENKIIEGILKEEKITQIKSIFEWKKPFSIYIWYENLEGDFKYHTVNEFVSSNTNSKYIKNNGHKRY